MKAFVITVLVVCCAVIAGDIVYLHRQNGSSIPKPEGEAPATQPTEPAPSENAAPPSPQAQLVVAQAPAAPQPAVITPSPGSQPSVESPTNAIRAMSEALLSAKSGLEKQAIFDELRTNGNLEAVTADLKQLAVQNPTDPEIPTTLGEADINEIRALKAAGGSDDQIGVLALQADQAFDAALQIDPNNWEAQFVKYSTLFYWPANPQTDNQAVQGLTSLIDQQQNMPSSPQFAQTYVMLGNEYQKIGQPDKALATWELGAQEYPADSTLQQKIASAAAK